MSAASPLHVLEIVGVADLGPAERRVLALARTLRAQGVRVSAVCPRASAVEPALRAAGCAVITGPIDDDPAWSLVRTAATLAVQDEVGVVHTQQGNAHVLGALVAAVTGRPLLATVHGDGVGMLDLEAHRFGARAHLHVLHDAAWHHALALGVARDAVHLVAVDAERQAAGADSGARADPDAGAAVRGLRALHALLARLAAGEQPVAAAGARAGGERPRHAAPGRP